jgi:transcriptional regulator with XRE-family HTH domain
MDLSDKIKLILSAKNLSPSIFADEIGVQRSSMSHILAGRNKPSLDIVQKIVKRFPDLGLNWIMDDQDLSFLAPEEIVKERVIASASKSGSNSDSKSVAETYQQQPSEQKAIPADPVTTTLVKESTKVVTKIVVFYSDGTFQELNPSS